ncbi:cyd operon YbgE family protein [Thiobacillus thioparus]|jgi:cyd operon protein YbgE|uniref:cyd operon YbgE family protein n=1 Tax=Thiobacillus thioparus TaxID=931 RepID=UPI00035E766E|nr:cyd operon YbgE family protein [Thiobacillus thioparus]
MNRVLDSGWARGVSLVSALALMILVTVFPRGLTVADGRAISHGVLTFIMWGMSAGFVHGVGFVPRNNVLRVLLGPVVAWVLMGVALIFYVQYFLR